MSTTTPQPTGNPNARLGQTVRDMGLSLAVVFVVVIGILLLQHRAQPDPVREVDLASPLTLATMQADFPVLVPQATDGYRLTSARWTGKPPIWHLGYVTPDTTYVQVVQSRSKSPTFITDQVPDVTQAGTLGIDGATWAEYRSASDVVLVRKSNGVTTLVSGTAGLEELTKVARSLATQR